MICICEVTGVSAERQQCLCEVERGVFKFEEEIATESKREEGRSMLFMQLRVR